MFSHSAAQLRAEAARAARQHDGALAYTLLETALRRPLSTANMNSPRDALDVHTLLYVYATVYATLEHGREPRERGATRIFFRARVAERVLAALVSAAGRLSADECLRLRTQAVEPSLERWLDMAAPLADLYISELLAAVITQLEEHMQ